MAIVNMLPSGGGGGSDFGSSMYVGYITASREVNSSTSSSATVTPKRYVDLTNLSSVILYNQNSTGSASVSFYALRNCTALYGNTQYNLMKGHKYTFSSSYAAFFSPHSLHDDTLDTDIFTGGSSSGITFS